MSLGIGKRVASKRRCEKVKSKSPPRRLHMEDVVSHNFAAPKTLESTEPYVSRLRGYLPKKEKKDPRVRINKLDRILCVRK